jgi:hypothetical protein
VNWWLMFLNVPIVFCLSVQLCGIVVSVL